MSERESRPPKPALAALRRDVLGQIDRVRRFASGTLVVVAIVEAALFIKLLTMVDFADHLHVMLLVITGLVYGTLGLGLVALGAYVRFWILQAVKALEPRATEP